MSQQAIGLLIQSIVAGGVVTQRRFVGYDGNQASVQGQPVAGVAWSANLVAGNELAITMAGTAIVECGVALNPGDRVISDNQGRAIRATPLAIAAGATAVTSVGANGTSDIVGSDFSEQIIGTVMPGQSSSAAGQFVEILLRH